MMPGKTLGILSRFSSVSTRRRRAARRCFRRTVCLPFRAFDHSGTCSRRALEDRLISYIVRDAYNFDTAHFYFASEKRSHTRRLMTKTRREQLLRLSRDYVTWLCDRPAADDHDS